MTGDHPRGLTNGSEIQHKQKGIGRTAEKTTSK